MRGHQSCRLFTLLTSSSNTSPSLTVPPQPHWPSYQPQEVRPHFPICLEFPFLNLPLHNSFSFFGPSLKYYFVRKCSLTSLINDLPQLCLSGQAVYFLTFKFLPYCLYPSECLAHNGCPISIYRMNE